MYKSKHRRYRIFQPVRRHEVLQEKVEIQVHCTKAKLESDLDNRAPISTPAIFRSTSPLLISEFDGIFYSAR
jgi:hypothetical protein